MHQPNIKKVHDLFEDGRVPLQQIVVDTDLSYHIIYDIITAELYVNKLSAICVPRMLTDAYKHTHTDITMVQARHKSRHRRNSRYDHRQKKPCYQYFSVLG